MCKSKADTHLFFYTFVLPVTEYDNTVGLYAVTVTATAAVYTH